MSSVVASLLLVVSSLLLPYFSTACTDNSIRLSDGRNEREGRLEICLDGVWGTVCNNPWSTENTVVACKELGIGDRGYYINLLPVGEAESPIHLTNIQCTGEESRLSDCSSERKSLLHVCSHRDDVRIVCISKDSPIECEDGSLQLVDGTSPYNGRLEICQANVWGTICSYGWDTGDAIVACRQLGFNATNVYLEWHSQGTGPILKSGVSCFGNETNITECASNSTALHDACRHVHDVGIFCSVLEPECTDGELKLVDGRTEYEGRVEVCQNGVWGSVCDDNWIPVDNGIVACVQAGITEFTEVLFGTFGVVRGPIHLSLVTCDGTEASLFDCIHANSRHEFCYPSEPVGVICVQENDTPECEEGIRLVDSSGFPANDSGLVEICIGGRWNRVCHRFWDRNEAEVVCDELGLSSSGAVGYLVDDGNYIGPVISASCHPDEELFSLYECLEDYSCLEQQHGVVICDSSDSNFTTCENGDLRIGNAEGYFVGSEYTVGGRLEICYQGVWGTVCDDGWNIRDAIVACRQLGHKTVGARFIHEYDPPGTGPVILDDLSCTGAEETLFDCANHPLNSHNCRVFENVGIYCNTFSTDELPKETTKKNIIIAATTVGLQSRSDQGLMLIAIIVGVVLILVIILAAVVAFVVILVRRRRRVKRKTESLQLNLAHANPVYMQQMSTPDSPTAHSNVYNMDTSTGISLRTHLAPPVPSNVRGSFIRQITEDFIISLKSLTLLTKIGEGEFGIVYKARLSYTGEVHDIVAVKTLKGMYSQEEVDAMLEEGLKLKHFQHSNVLSLIGVCVEAGPAPYIVMPFMGNGSLLSYLRREKMALVLSENEDEETVDDVTKRLTTMCQQISKGMKYLAGEKFVHRDLAARNCMIDEHYVIKIADFGLSEDIYSKTYFRQQEKASVKLPVKWMAIESLQEGIFSEKTDVWSYGVTCWEVFSGGKTPYPGIGPMSVVEMLENGERLMQPNNAACTEKMYAMMKTCWELEPESRPTFSEINELLDNYLEELAGYMNIQNCLFPEMQQAEGVQLRDKNSRTWKRSNSFQMDMRTEDQLQPYAVTGQNGRAVSMVAPSKSEQML